MKKKLLSILLSLAACSNGLWAQETEPVEETQSRPVTSSILLGVGKGDVRDTYLTPLLYKGTALDIRFERTRLMRSMKWENQQLIDGEMMFGADDKSDNSSAHMGRFRYRYAMHRLLWSPSLSSNTKTTFALGWVAGLDLGFNYNLKMAASNNPATVRYTTNGGVSAMARHIFPLRGKKCGMTLQVQAPLLGWALVPEYGASYYETFYLKHVDHNVHFTSLHNQQDIDVRLTADVPFTVIPGIRYSRSALRLGMMYHRETMDINKIITRQQSLLFVFGWTWQYSPQRYSAR
ncbi:MAG: DUF3316 domain-containing protein [Bacteroidales bacterium]|nr:DUF3316 domain-containing protein [Bacteroidales bacterium]